MNNIFLYTLTVLIWGSTWFAINFQLGNVEPEASVVYRYVLASAVIFIFCILKQQSLKFSLRAHCQLFAFGICLFGINYFLLYNAQQNINSALACIAFSTLMIMNIFNARLFFGTKIKANVYLGSFLGLVGIITLFWPQVTNLSLSDSTVLGFVLCLVGTLSASFGNMLSIKNQQDGFAIMPANAWAMGYGALFMTVLLLLQGKSFSFEWSFSYLGSLLYLSIFGSVIAFACYLTLLTKIGAQKASYANILFPAVAVAISTMFEGFIWSEYTLMGFVAIMLGNVVIITDIKKLRARKTNVPASI
ncbi:DMT family transporter [Thalassotalea marina]|uniref:Membrane protein n=1 Tax=Thalassotalea marina TaxID=1673741 RepID=A0A919BP04_9GAMM|nr:EamA family transporter [Thalassotalea marina]GHG04295.1 membrane protein [Thalassotalea marina]